MPVSATEIHKALSAFKAEIDALPHDALEGSLYPAQFDHVEDVRWSQKPPSWTALSTAFDFVFESYGTIPESKMMRGDGGILRVWRLLERIGVGNLAAEKEDDAMEAFLWIKNLTMAVARQRVSL
ncbi:hypothetical protein RQP46_005655 [Phenoliferia psychrophenolica]